MTTTVTSPGLPAAGRLASSTRRENKRGYDEGNDTGDCTAQRTQSQPRHCLEPGTVKGVGVGEGATNGSRRHENSRNNKTTARTKPNVATTARGFYSISETLGFKLDDRECSDCEHNNDNNSNNCNNNNHLGNNNDDNCEHGDRFSKSCENDSVQDLNKCDPSCYNNYYTRNKLDEDDSDDEEDGGDFVIRSHVAGINGPTTTPDNIHDLTTTPDNIHDLSTSPRDDNNSSTPTDFNFPQSLKSRSSSYPNAILHSQHHQHQQHQQPQAVSISCLTLNLPERSETITQRFGVKMVATPSCQQLMYRSVPPRPLSYTLTDVLDPKGPNQRSKTAPVSVNSPDDYVQRFKSRPTTRPRVIEFDGSTVSSKSKKMAMTSPGFPTARAKIYIGHIKAMSPTQQNQTARTPSSRLQLAPLEHSGRRSTSGFTPGSSRTTRMTDRSHGKGGGGDSLHGNQTAVTRAATKSAGSAVHDWGNKSTTSMKPSALTHDTIQSAEFSMSVPVPRAPTPDTEDHIHNPELLLTSNSDCDDLSALPRPKKVLPKRELPWVFRYKVKKGMNTLSRIMASKPSPNAVQQTSYSLT